MNYFSKPLSLTCFNSFPISAWKFISRRPTGLLMLVCALLVAACGDEQPAATPLPLSTPIIVPTDPAAPADILPPPSTTQATSAATDTPSNIAATVTTPSEATAAPTNTAEPAATTLPAETVTATALPTGSDAITAGGGVSDTLAAGEIRAYRYTAPAAFEPVVILIEPAGQEDLLLRAYDQPVTAANAAV